MDNVNKNKDENHYGPAIAIAIIVVILFFGGWYLFIGQALTGPTSPAPTAPEINTNANPIVYGTSTENTNDLEATTSDVGSENLPAQETGI
ncbi:MAG: hypothetical protein WC640_01690 [Candidatus Paceibacterota bacterium]|jgi:hypothetical protein